MNEVSPWATGLLCGVMLVLAVGAGLVSGGALRLVLPVISARAERIFGRFSPARASRLTTLVSLALELGLLGGLAVGLGGLFTVGGALSLGGVFSADALKVLRGPWLVSGIAGTFFANLGAVVGAWTRGERFAFGLPAIRWFVVAPALAALVVLVVAGWSLFLGFVNVGVEQQGLAEALAGAQGWLRVLVLGYVVFGAPILEETMFRGWIQPLLARQIGPRFALGAQACLFGLLHLDRLWAIPPIIFIGLACGWLRARSGSILPGIVLHILNNSLALLAS